MKLTDSGGRCSWCFAEDKWESIHYEYSRIDQNSIQVSEMFVCRKKVAYVNCLGFTECGHTIILDYEESPGYEEED